MSVGDRQTPPNLIGNVNHLCFVPPLLLSFLFLFFEEIFFTLFFDGFLSFMVPLQNLGRGFSGHGHFVFLLLRGQVVQPFFGAIMHPHDHGLMGDGPGGWLLSYQEVKDGTVPL